MRNRRRRNSKEHRELGRWESNSHWHRNTLEFTKIKGGMRRKNRGGLHIGHGKRREKIESGKRGRSNKLLPTNQWRWDSTKSRRSHGRHSLVSRGNGISIRPPGKGFGAPFGRKLSPGPDIF